MEGDRDVTSLGTGTTVVNKRQNSIRLRTREGNCLRIKACVARVKLLDETCSIQFVNTISGVSVVTVKAEEIKGPVVDDIHREGTLLDDAAKELIGCNNVKGGLQANTEIGIKV